MEPRAVLVIGGGGREHAMQWSLSKSPQVSTVICAPGNAGTPNRSSLNISDLAAVDNFITENKIALTVIGPEAPLVAGLSDYLRQKGHLVVGASQRAAELEGSKVFSKEFMRRNGIPTADFRIFTDA